MEADLVLMQVKIKIDFALRLPRKDFLNKGRRALGITIDERLSLYNQLYLSRLEELLCAE